MPLGKLTPTVQPTKILAAALSVRDAMADCTLSDAAISLIALRLNTGAPIAKLARGLGIGEANAYLMMRSPQAQHLMAELAQGVLAGASVDAVHTMAKIMKGRDPNLAYRAAEHLMERAGLGISQRSTPDGSTKTVFAFAFGAPQATHTEPQHVAHAIGHAQMGPTAGPLPAAGPSKTQGLAVGEGDPPAILEQPEPGPLRAHRPRRQKSSEQP